MSLLQDPIKAVDQIRWYLDNRNAERFPGAFLLAAGNLARQVLEQVLFILAFYSHMPRNRFLKNGRELRSVSRILKELQKTEPTTGKRYLELARMQGPRVRKFARYPRSLEKWRRILNRPSHFNNPGSGSPVDERELRRFVDQVGSLFISPDGYLIVAAVNEIRSNGFIKAQLLKNANNTPSVLVPIAVTPNILQLNEQGGLFPKLPGFSITIVPDSKEVPYRWKKRVVLVQHSSGMSTSFKYITRSGATVNVTDLRQMLKTFADDPRDRKLLTRRLCGLGFHVEYKRRNGDLFLSIENPKRSVESA